MVLSRGTCSGSGGLADVSGKLVVEAMVRDIIRLFMGLLRGRLVERRWSEPVRAKKDGRFEGSRAAPAKLRRRAAWRRSHGRSRSSIASGRY
jgi:hypothetical protein